MAESRLLFFGDQTVEALSTLKQLNRQSKNSPSLQTFFRETTHALQSQVAKLYASERRRFRYFDSISGLAEAHAQSGINDVVVSTILLCVAQLGSLITHVENEPSILESTSSEVYILGLCTGLLPAAAAATAKSASELLKLAPEIVCVALRLALETSHRSTQLEQCTDSWAVVVGEIPARAQQNAIDDFHKEHAIPLHKYAYISAESDSSTTISGPPSVLALLFTSSKTLSKAPRARLPIAAAYHASHLGKPNADKIVGSFLLQDRSLKRNSHIMSTSSSTPFVADSLSILLHQIIDDILQLPLYWSKTVQAVVSSLSKADINLTILGPTSMAKSLRRALEKGGITITETDHANTPPAGNMHGGSGAVAVVGMSGRFPGGESLREFWEVLKKGQDLHKKVPKDRFDVKTHCDPSGAIKNTTLTPYCCFIDRPGLFDTRLFNMSPREAAQIDPIQRLLLMATYEALEMAGYSQDDSLRIGTYFGQTTDDWRESNASQDIDLYYVPGGMRAFGPGRLNYHFKWEGPSYSLDTACSSSSASIEMACRALLIRDCDTAVAGGGNIMTGPQMFAGLSRGNFLSPTGPCKTFDDDADGYCRGDAVGVVVLKRLEDAIANHDNIQGVIRSVATNHSAHAISITHPHAPTQQKLYRRVLNEASVEPNEVDYVEMHGTGTQAGDSSEMKSVTNVFGQGRMTNNPLYIGAVKANVGHGEAAAGITSLIKAILMLQKNVIPPHPGIKGRINHKFPPLAEMNVRIADSPVAFTAHPGGDGRRKILLNNFNATGGNTSMLLEDPPPRHVGGEDPRSHHVVAISARTLSSLRRNKERLLEYLTTKPHTQLPDVAYTTTARRMHHVFRTAHAVGSTQELMGVITKDLAGSTEPSRTASKPSIVFAFTGQGSQYPSMGKQLFETCPTFRESILEFSELCKQHGLPPFLDMIKTSDPNLKTMTPIQIQLGLVSLELALAMLWQSWGLVPDAVIGHSLGEYPALCVAGVLSVSDMLFLVGKRAELMQKKCTAHTHSMLTIQSPVKSIQQVLLAEQVKSCVISCINSPGSTVVSGTVEEVKTLQERLQVDGVKTTLLEVPYAFHSPQMESILEDFEAIAQKIRFAKPVVPVASTHKGQLIRDEGVFGANYLIRQADRRLISLELCKLVCPRVLLTTRHYGSRTDLDCLKSNEDCWKTLSRGVANAYNAGADITWPDFHKAYDDALSLLELPTYSFDLKDYWIQYGYEGDWALMQKGQQATIESVPAPVPAFSMTCLQRVESETCSENEASVTFVSDPTEPKLFNAIQGHLVHGVGLCPASVYSDMAFTAASYLYTKMESSKPVPAMDVAHMEVFRPLVVLPDSRDQLIKVSASRSAGVDSVEVYFSSENGHESNDHAHCTVHLGNGNAWKGEWARNSYLVKTRMDGLINSANTGAVVHRILGPMVYKLFSALVLYDEKYRGLKEVFLDSTLNEAAAEVKFQPSAGNGQFTYSPYWIDSIVHLAGFVLNGNVTTPEDIVYISHGWESLRIAGALSEDTSYTSYVRMQPSGGRGVFVGDVYIFEGDEVVAVCGGLKFQEMKKNILGTLLSRSSKLPTKMESTHVSGRNATAEPSAGLRTSSKVQSASKLVVQTRMDPSSNRTSPAPMFSQVLDIIAAEVGLGVSDLVDETNFEEAGIDSLLKISITSKLRAQMALDLPTSIFTSYGTVAELRDYFQDSFHGQRSSDSSDETSASHSDDTNTPSESSVSMPKSPSAKDDSDVAGIFISAVATEAGLDASEIEPSTLFTDLGVDSLMSIAILGVFKDQTGMMLPASFFNDHPTAAKVRKALQTSSSSEVEAPRLPPPSKPAKSGSRYSSNSVFLQGRPSSGLTPLFLIADGAGSAASYINLPPFSSGLPVYALESPFLHIPTEYNCSFEAVASMYVDEIRNIQPRGPYQLGGWSLGGIHAYEVARQLLARGEEVQGIVMIDSPCPKPLPDMPEPTIELMEQTGLFIGVKRAGKPDAPMPLKTKQHLVSCVRALKVYDPIPMDRRHLPAHVFIIWAKHGLFDELGDKVKEASELAPDKNDGTATEAATEEDVGLKKDWLTAERKSFGANGWDRLVGDIECHAIDGDHFSIMNLPQIKVTGGLVQRALNTFMEVS